MGGRGVRVRVQAGRRPAGRPAGRSRSRFGAGDGGAGVLFAYGGYVRVPGAITAVGRVWDHVSPRPGMGLGEDACEVRWPTAKGGQALLAWSL